MLDLEPYFNPKVRTLAPPEASGPPSSFEEIACKPSWAPLGKLPWNWRVN